MKIKLRRLTLLVSIVFLGAFAFSFASDKYLQGVYFDNKHTLYILGKEKELDKETKMIYYDNRVYLPLRAVSESLGFDVNYDAGNKSIHIDKKMQSSDAVYLDVLVRQNGILKKELEELKEKYKELEKVKIEQKEEQKYKKMPLSYFDTTKDFRIYLDYMANEYMKTNTSRWYITIKNNSAEGVNFETSTVKFTYMDEKEGLVTVKEPLAFKDEYVSKELYSTMQNQFDKQVYFSLDTIPKDVKKGTLTFDISWLDSKKVETITYDIEF